MLIPHPGRASLVREAKTERPPQNPTLANTGRALAFSVFWLSGITTDYSARL